MVHLDRENGAILLPDGSVVPYDVLVLCPGLQVTRNIQQQQQRILLGECAGLFHEGVKATFFCRLSSNDIPANRAWRRENIQISQNNTTVKNALFTLLSPLKDLTLYSNESVPYPLDPRIKRRTTHHAA